ncbi:peptidase U32 [Clostridia bacterium]|nr:peptidase U32 [Clostridia bacterium]
MELLSPAGNITALKTALLYGADAVYLGYRGVKGCDYSASDSLSISGDGCNFSENKNSLLTSGDGCNFSENKNSLLTSGDGCNFSENKNSLLALGDEYNFAKNKTSYGFGMRAKATNFSYDELKIATDLAHSINKKIFLTLNIIPHNEEIKLLPAILEEAKNANIDALIVADLGVLSVCKKLAPEIEIHMSTQTGIANFETARYLHEMGASRVVLARELSLDEIYEIRAKTPKDLEIECFVHGAMCVSFSGRCLISAYMTNRDANRGECAQPCRWNYALMEEKRQGEYFPVTQDERGTYFFNSKDLCMLEHIDKLAKAGVDSLKIEGRAKSEYYVASTTTAYRNAIDCYTQGKNLPNWVKEEVYKISHRGYCTGFFFGNNQNNQVYETSSYIRDWEVVAIIEHSDGEFIYLEQRNRFYPNDELEILSPNAEPVTVQFPVIYNSKGEQIEVANIATAKLKIPCEMIFPQGGYVRKLKVRTMSAYTLAL